MLFCTLTSCRDIICYQGDKGSAGSLTITHTAILALHRNNEKRLFYRKVCSLSCNGRSNSAGGRSTGQNVIQCTDVDPEIPEMGKWICLTWTRTPMGDSLVYSIFSVSLHFRNCISTPGKRNYTFNHPLFALSQPVMLHVRSSCYSGYPSVCPECGPVGQQCVRMIPAGSAKPCRQPILQRG